LSITASAPQLAEVAQRHRSLLLGLRAQRRAQPPDPHAPLFHSLRGGLSRLVDALVANLRAAGVELHTSTAVDALPTGPVVLAVPAFAAVPLVPAEVGGQLERIAYASVVVLTFDYAESAVPDPLDGSGLLLPRPDGHLATAVSFFSAKWPGVADPGRITLRVSAGRFGDDRASALGDQQLQTAVRDELHELLGIVEAPLVSRVTRWPRSFPQYEPGHLARMERLDQSVAAWRPDVVLAGAAYRGIGIPACIRQGRQAARHVLAAAGDA
jgi:oxygen-dependent protoporphyrinogen oxidase